MKKILLITLGLSSILFADFTKTGNILTDNSTTLQWQDDAIGSTMTWTNAIAHCEGLSLDGQSDWRLPNIKELTSLVDDSKINPAIDSVFSYTVSGNYWSSTTHAGSSDYAWGVYFNNGRQHYGRKSISSYVRCVRAGQ